MATRSLVFPAERFQTVVACPVFARAAARALPIAPSPRTLTWTSWFVVMFLGSVGVAGVVA